MAALVCSLFRILFFFSKATNKVYGCVVDMADHLVRKDGGKFDFQEFQAHPEKYASNFSRKVSHYISLYSIKLKI